MKSLILTTATNYLLPLLFLFSVFILFRGHNEPGGGFIGGLVVAVAYCLYAIAVDVGEAQRLLRVSPLTLTGLGLFVALVSGLVAPLVAGQPFMTGLWGALAFPIVGTPGTPILFDIGVYMTVIGVTLLIVFSLLTEESS